MAIQKFSKEDFICLKTSAYDDQDIIDKINIINKIIDENLNKGDMFEHKKSWRSKKPNIKKKNLSILETYCNEINSFLNKLSPKNYDKITIQILGYFEKPDIKEDSSLAIDILNKCIDNLFEKATMQPIYCPYYVKFVKLLDDKFSVIDHIENRCNQYKEIVKDEDINVDNMSDKEKYDLFCKENKEKIFKNGYSQFIGELYNNKLIQYDTIINNLNFFISSLESIIKSDKEKEIENNIICICTLIKTIYKNINNKKDIKDICIKLETITKKDIPKRLYFKILDLKDLII